MYFRNQLTPKNCIPGLVPKSYPSLGDIVFNTDGRINATNVHAAAFIPSDWENKSMLNPRLNEENNNSHPGVLKGRSRINII